MKKPIFFNQKENITLFSLIVLIVLSFVLMRFQYNSITKKSDFPTVSKAKTPTTNQIDVPRFLPAL